MSFAPSRKRKYEEVKPSTPQDRIREYIACVRSARLCAISLDQSNSFYRYVKALAEDVRKTIKKQCKLCSGGSLFASILFDRRNTDYDAMLERHANFPILFWHCNQCPSWYCIEHIGVRIDAPMRGFCPSRRPHGDTVSIFSLPRRNSWRCRWSWFEEEYLPTTAFWSVLFIRFMKWIIWKWWKRRRVFIARKRFAIMDDALRCLPRDIVKTLISETYDHSSFRDSSTIWTFDGTSVVQSSSSSSSMSSSHGASSSSSTVSVQKSRPNVHEVSLSNNANTSG